MNDEPDLSAMLPSPTPLRRTAVVNFVWGTDHFSVVCSAVSLRYVSGPGSGGEEIDWLHVNGFQGAPHVKVNPSGNIATTPYLIPAKYVTHISYGGRFKLVEAKKSEDLGIFPAIHRSPDAAMTLTQIRDIIEGLQLNPGVPESLMYSNYVREVSDRFDQSLVRIKAEHGFEYGSEFEIAICKTLRTVLPQKYGVCRGYVVSALGEKAGDDIIIYDRMRFPTLRALETDEFAVKEQVPIEAVYAYIEAKHSLCIEGDGGSSFQKALTQVARVKILCDRRQSVPLFEADFDEKGSDAKVGWPEIRNPAYGIIVARNVRQREGGPVLQNPKDIMRQLVSAKVSTLHPPDFCIMGKNNMLVPVVPDVTTGGMVMASPFFQKRISSANMVLVDGVSFGAGLSILLWGLSWINLGEMPWPAILEDCIPPHDAALDFIE